MSTAGSASRSRTAGSPFFFLGGLLLLYLAVPIVALLFRLGSPAPAGFGAAGLGPALVTSLLTASISVLLIAILGIPLAFVLARARGRLARVAGIVVQLPLALPPLMSGILLIYLVGPYAPLGFLHLTDSPAGIVLAQTFVAAPFLVIAARSAFAEIAPALTDVARTLGLSAPAIFFRVCLPLARRGIAAGMLLAWLRAFGEFGATVIVAYHPYSLPVFTYVQFSGGGLEATMAPTLLALLAAVVVLGLTAWSPGRRAGVGQRDGVPPSEPSSTTPAQPPARAALLEFHLDQRLGSFHLEIAYRSSTRRLAILGPSGAGKSTALRALAGLFGPDAGRVRLGERDLTAVPAEGRRSGYVPQEASLFPHLSVWQQLVFGEGAVPQRAGLWLRRLGLDGLQDRFPDQLSSGQRQRVALARALSRDPSMLLLDEPFASLDTPVRNELRRELRGLQLGATMTSVLVTHDPEEAALLADEILVIEGGKLLQAGARAEVFGRPASARVARLLGIRNLVEGRIVERGLLEAGGVQFHVAADSLPPGVDVRWCVPAECIALGARGSHRATVLDVADLGSSSEIQLRLQGLELTARTPTPASLRPGTECYVELPAEAIRIWPAEGVTS